MPTRARPASATGEIPPARSGTAGGQFALAIDPVRGQGLDAGADHGVMTMPGGERYEGEFRDGEAHGYGVMTWPEPICGRFEGEWVEGRARWTPTR